MDTGMILAKWLFIAVGALALVLVFRSHASADGAISPNEAATWIKDKKDLQLIDVRTPSEYEAGHLAKAKLIPLQELESRLTEIERSKPILLYCRSGHRSGNALKILVANGYTQAKHMEGGITAWQVAELSRARHVHPGHKRSSEGYRQHRRSPLLQARHLPWPLVRGPIRPQASQHRFFHKQGSLRVLRNES